MFMELIYKVNDYVIISTMTQRMLRKDYSSEGNSEHRIFRKLIITSILHTYI